MEARGQNRKLQERNCGAGGDAAAARSVGYKIAYGWDSCAKACETFKMNHGRTAEVYQVIAEDVPSF
jgi:hypothetical protein